MSTITDYPTSARSIALNLQQFCNKKLTYPEMIADAARKAAKRIEELEEALRKIAAMKKLETETTFKYAFNRSWHIATEALTNNQSAKVD